MTHRGAPVLRRIIFVLLLMLLGILSLGAQTQAPNTIAKPGAGETKQSISPKSVSIPLFFEANKGQTDSRVKFLTRGNGYTLFMTPTETVLAESGSRMMGNKEGFGAAPEFKSVPAGALRMQLIGANRAPRMKGSEELPGKLNYLMGNDPAQWHTGVPLFSRVRTNHVYPGVDLVFHGNERALEYDFVVAPGADPNQVAFRIRGAKRIEIDSRGDLVLHTAGSEFRMHKPVIYQTDGASRKAVDGGFILSARNEVRFQLGAYDRTQELVIDPAIGFSSFLGGAGFDIGNGFVVDDSSPGSPKLYISGETSDSTSFTEPKTVIGSGTSTTAPRVTEVGFVAKIDPTATGAASLIYLTFIGGKVPFQAADGGCGSALIWVALDKTQGAANVQPVLGAQTTCSDFPTTTTINPVTAPTQKDFAVVATRLTTSGAAVDKSALIGGNDQVTAPFVSVGVGGEVLIAGATSATNLPVKNPYVATLNNGNAGFADCFVAKLERSDLAATYLTYTNTGGGSTKINSSGCGAFDDSSGNILAGGNTVSPTAFNLGPGGASLANGFEPTFPANATDATWAIKLNPNLSGINQLVFATYFAGGGKTTATNGAFDLGNGVMAIVGRTNSNTAIGDIPLKNAFQTQNKSAAGTNGQTGYLVLGDTTKTGAASLLCSTYFGGSSGNDIVGGVGYDAGDPTNFRILLSGQTTSTDFPVMNEIQPYVGASGSPDGFVSVLSVPLPGQAFAASLVFSTYIGGSNPPAQINTVPPTIVEDDRITGVGVDSNHTIYAVGSTNSPQGFFANTNPATTVNGFQTACASCSGSTVFDDVVIFSIKTGGSATLNSIAVTPTAASIATGQTQQFHAVGNYSDGTEQELTNTVAWSTVPGGIATMSTVTPGLAIGVAPGVTAVTPTLGSTPVLNTGSLTVTGTGPVLVSIAVTPNPASVGAGSALQFTATGKYSDGSMQNITSTVTWNSSNNSAATISNAAGSQGLAAAGNTVGAMTTITAALGGVTSPGVTLTVAASDIRAALVAFTGNGISPVTVTWNPPFADANYTAVCTVETTPSDFLLPIIALRTATSMTVIPTGGSAPGTLDCIAIPDSDTSNIHHGRVAFNNSPTTVTVTWSPAFADTNYTVACTLETQGPTGGGFTSVISALSAASINVDGGGIAAGTIHCIAVPDSDAGTVRHGRATFASTPATVAVNWNNAFADSNYAAACSDEQLGTTSSDKAIAINAGSKLAGSVTTIPEIPSGMVHCIGAPVIAVSSGPTTHFLVTAPADATAGTPINFAVTAKDAANNTVTTYPGTVNFSSTDAAATLPSGDVGLTNGVGNFQATLNTVGSQTITVTDSGTASINGTSNTITVSTVTGPTLTSIAVTPLSPTIGPGQNQQFTATGTFSSGPTQDITATVTWASSLPAVATISNASGSQGLATAVADGSTLITATSGNISGVAALTVAPPIGFVLTGNMTTVRDFPTATLLNDGTVLVAGGTTNAAILASSELYNSASRTFAPTGNMTTARIQDTATLLPNGMVLLTGGISSFPHPPFPSSVPALATTELFNPATGTFTATGSMTTARFGHTATLLNNGMVLLTGGASTDIIGPSAGPIPLASAELFNPATGTITATGSMTNARIGQTATLLNNGMVLIAGGDRPATASAELYNPATGAFTTTGSMTTARANQTATLLNTGMVLMTGGFDSGNNSLASAELFNPATGTFTATGSMTTTRVSDTATLLNNGTVLVTGGYILSGGGIIFIAVPSAELYDPTAGTFTETGRMNTARDSHTATLLNNGMVLVVGGDDFDSDGSGAAFASAEVYTPSTMTPPGLTSIAVTPANPTIAVGTFQRFVATGTFSSGPAQTLASVTWSSSNTGVAAITNDAGSKGFADASPGTTTITAAAGAINGSTLLTVTGPTTHFLVTAPATATAGTPINFTLTAQDAANNTATSYTGTVHFTSTDGAATLPANATLTNGVGNFQALLKTVGPQTITAADTVTASVTGTSNSIAVSATSIPVLFIVKTHVGNFVQGQQGAQYTVTVSNTGTGPTSGTVTMTETVPSGLTLVSLAGTGWTCATPNTANVCTRSDVLASGVPYPPITVTVNVAANAISPQVNHVDAAGGSSAPAIANDSTAITLQQSTLTVTEAGTGTGTVSSQADLIPAIACTTGSANGCSANYNSGTSVTLTAVAATGSTFAGWSGACVNATGTCTAVMTQARNVTATFSLNAPTLVSIAVTPANPTVVAGQSQQFTATGTFSDGTKQDITVSVVWASSNTESATITAGGLATSLTGGTNTTISATKAQSNTNIVGNTTLTVTTVPFVLTITPAPGGNPGTPFTVAPGGTVAIGLVLTATPGFSGTVTFSCVSDRPQFLTCAPAPSSVTLSGNTPKQVAIVMNTFCKGETPMYGPGPGGFGGGLALLIAAAMLASIAWAYRTRPQWALSFALLMLIALGGAACSGPASGPAGRTPAGNYTLNITATTAGGSSQTVQVPIQVTN
jgi:Big-like domain-containing protein/List-Bact-rpt repeat protein